MGDRPMRPPSAEPPHDGAQQHAWACANNILGTSSHCTNDARRRAAHHTWQNNFAPLWLEPRHHPKGKPRVGHGMASHTGQHDDGAAARTRSSSPASLQHPHRTPNFHHLWQTCADEAAASSERPHEGHNRSALDARRTPPPSTSSLHSLPFSGRIHQLQRRTLPGAKSKDQGGCGGSPDAHVG